MAPEDRRTEQFNARVRPNVAAWLSARMQVEGIAKRSDLLIACLGIALATTPPGELLARAGKLTEEDRRRFG